MRCYRVVFLLLLAPQALFAFPKHTPLELGMTYQEVIQKWGPPLEKQEREASRKDVWSFSDGREVVFYEGKVVSLNGSPLAKSSDRQGESLGALDLDVPSLLAEKKTEPQRKTSQYNVEEILSEVMNDAPEEGGEKMDKRSSLRRKKKR